MHVDESGDAETWQWVGEIGHAKHFVVWIAIIELENEGVYPINSTNVRRRFARMLGEDISRENVLTSMRRLVEKDVIEQRDVDEWHGGNHWSTTDEAWEVAQTIAAKWQDVAGDDVDRADD